MSKPNPAQGFKTSGLDHGSEDLAANTSTTLGGSLSSGAARSSRRRNHSTRAWPHPRSAATTAPWPPPWLIPRAANTNPFTQTVGWDKQIGCTVFTGIGVGLTLQPSLIAIQGAVPRKTMAVVTAMRNFVRNLGGAIGLALSGTIVRTYLNATDLPDEAAAPFTPEVQEAHRKGFRTVDRADDSALKEQGKEELAAIKAAKVLKQAGGGLVGTLRKDS
ncbi:hypothetical protein V8E36_003134 [Tilletia maclaganii]